VPHNALPLAAAPSRQRRKQARPQELLEAALAVFVEKGFAAARSEDLAARAGVSKGLLYVYYPSKEELFKAVIRHHLSNLIAEGQALVDAYSGPTPALLQELIAVWWERFGSTPAAGLHKVIVAEVRNFPDLAQFYADEVIVPADRLFSSAVARGIERGEFRALPVHDVAHVLIAPLIFLALHQHSFGACPVHGVDLDPHTMMRTHLDLLLRGLMAAVPPRQRAAAKPRARS
jgi:AcrR family transcriptional regulator